MSSCPSRSDEHVPLADYGERNGSHKFISLRLDGILGGSCARRVERAILAVPGVIDVRISVLHGCGEVELSGPTASTRDITEAVRRAGYDVAPLLTRGASVEAWDHALRARLREQRQAVGQAVAMAAPILALAWLAPVLRSGDTGGNVWPQVLQAILCVLLLGSSAGAVILVAGLRSIIFRVPSNDLLPALALAAALVAGVVGLFLGVGGSVHFGDLAIVAVLLNVGRYVEWRVRLAAANRMRGSVDVVAPDAPVPETEATGAKSQSCLAEDDLRRQEAAANLSDRAATVMILAAVFFAIVCAMAPLVVDDFGWSQAVRRGVAVLLIVSPAIVILGAQRDAALGVESRRGNSVGPRVVGVIMTDSTRLGLGRRSIAFVALYHVLGIMASASGALPPGGAVLGSAAASIFLVRRWAFDGVRRLVR